MEMKINNTDAQILGVKMGKNFLDAIGASAPLKPLVENKASNQHGKSVFRPNIPYLDERDVTLYFNIEGASESDFLAKKKAFEQILYKGLVTIYIPANNETYRLTYQKCQEYAQNTRRTFCKMCVKFNEANPNNRSN